jgi:hypothetical protein
VAKFRDRKIERAEHKAVPMTSPGKPGPAKVDEGFERLVESSRSAVGPDTFPPTAPEPDRKTKLVRRSAAARVLAERLGDKPMMDGLGDLAERLTREQFDEAGFEDMEKLLGEIQKGLDEAAGPRSIHISLEDMPAEEQTRLVEELRNSPPMPITSAGLPKLAAVTGAVENLEQVAGLPRGYAAGHEREAGKSAVAARLAIESRAQRLDDEHGALEHVRRIASPGESLVQAVERLESLANAGADLLPMVGGDLKRRAVGVIVEDVEKERHVVHVFERGGGSLRVWAYNKGEKMPWHAARDVVEKLVETRLTPEDKR